MVSTNDRAEVGCLWRHCARDWNQVTRPWHGQIAIAGEGRLGTNRRGRRSYRQGPLETRSGLSRRK